MCWLALLCLCVYCVPVVNLVTVATVVTSVTVVPVVIVVPVVRLFTVASVVTSGDFGGPSCAVTDLQKKFAESSEVLSRTFKKKTQEVDEKVKAVD